MLVALPYILIASICSSSAADGGPGWLHLIVLWACWNALKFIIMGPTSLLLLVRASIAEAAARHEQRAERLELALVGVSQGLGLRSPAHQGQSRHGCQAMGLERHVRLLPFG